jgi:RNA polymerase sigma-70 factor (ECF subfamily)
MQTAFTQTLVTVPRPVSVPTDVALIRRIAEGDRLAMQSLYATHQVRVFRYVLRLVRDRATAEDVVSDVFLDVWRHAGRFKAQSAVSTWLLGIARYKALSAIRQGRGEVGIEAAAALEDRADNPEVATQKNRTGEILRRCMSGLTVIQSEVIDLVYYQGKSIREISQIISIPEATVKTRVFHARQRLGELLLQAGVDRVAA